MEIDQRCDRFDVKHCNVTKKQVEAYREKLLNCGGCRSLSGDGIGRVDIFRRCSHMNLRMAMGGDVDECVGACGCAGARVHTTTTRGCVYSPVLELANCWVSGPRITRVCQIKTFPTTPRPLSGCVGKLIFQKLQICNKSSASKYPKFRT